MRLVAFGLTFVLAANGIARADAPPVCTDRQREAARDAEQRRFFNQGLDLTPEQKACAASVRPGDKADEEMHRFADPNALPLPLTAKGWR